MSGTWINLKQTLRSLMRSPGFTAAAVLTLALGIGLNSAMLAVFDRLFLNPLPFRNQDRLVAIFDADTQLGWTHNTVAAANFQDYQGRSTRFEAVAAYRDISANLSGEGEAESIKASRVSLDFFRVLGIQPRSGRLFAPEEDRENGPRAVLLSHAFWTSRYGSDPSVLGRNLRLNGVPHEVVGVLPEGIHFGGLLDGQVFVPMRFGPPGATNRGDHSYSVLGRLRPDSSAEQADQDLKRVARELAAEFPITNAYGSASVVPLVEVLTDAHSSLAFILMSISGFLLLIACANVSNLILARGIARQHELAIRTALGADRMTLARGMLTECVLLGLMGAFGALAIGKALLTLVQHLFPDLPQLAETSLGDLALLYALGSTFVAVVVAGFIPIWRLSHVQPVDAMKDGQRGSTGLKQRRFQVALMATQIALSMVLLTGSGLMIRSLWKLQQVELGFKPEGVLTGTVMLPEAKYPDAAARQAFAQRLQERLSRMPGVESAAVANAMPVVSQTGNRTVREAGKPPLSGSQDITWTNIVTPAYFATMGIPVLQGEVPEAPAPDACLVNDKFMRLHGLGLDAIGKQLEAGALGGRDIPLYTIVGIVGNARNRGLHREPAPQIYTFFVPGAREASQSQTIYLKCTGQPWNQVGPLKAALHELDPDLACSFVRTVDQSVQLSLQGRSTTTSLFILFGSLGLLLAAVGLYGLMAYMVAQRNRELGIRMALGAEARQVLVDVLRQGLGITVVGLALGLLVSLALGRFLASQLFQVSPTDPITMVLSALVLAMVSLAASLVPASQAVRVNPVVVLRNE